MCVDDDVIRLRIQIFILAEGLKIEIYQDRTMLERMCDHELESLEFLSIARQSILI